MTDPQLFEYEHPLRPPPRPKPRPLELVMREPGWRLLSRRDGPQGYHRIRTIGLHGSVVSNCGIVGHVVTEHQPKIVECQACLEADN